MRGDSQAVVEAIALVVDDFGSIQDGITLIDQFDIDELTVGDGFHGGRIDQETSEPYRVAGTVIGLVGLKIELFPYVLAVKFVQVFLNERSGTGLCLGRF